MTQAAETFDRGKKLQQREKEEQKKTFKAEERECALRGVSPEEMPEHLRPLDTTEALDVHEAILCAGSSNLSRTFKGHAGANALPRMTRELEGLLLYELSSMHPIIDHEANFTNIVSQLTPLSSHIRSLVTYRGDGLLPSTIRVEECHYNDEDSDGKLVVAQGILHAQSLSNICDDHDSKAMMDSGAHRAGVITAFDPRTVKMFDNDPPAFFGNKSKLVWRFSTLTREFSTTHRQGQNANVLESDRQILGIEHIETLLRNTNTGGLHYYYDYFKIDPFVTFPVGCSSLVEWLAIKSPTMIRVLQLLDKHIRQDGNRVLLMVDTLWIQSFVTSLLVHFGYTAITIRTSDIPAARQEVIEKWNDPESDLDVFVGNVNTLNIGVKLHSACHLGIFLNWHLDPTTMEKNFRRLDGPDQREAVQWFLLKQADSYQDNVERLLVQNWIVTSSSKCGLTLWMDNEILEISLCEVMKSLWHQPFNRYAWLVEHEYSQFEMSYHADHIIILGHVFSMLARLFLSAHDKTERDFYNGNVDVLVEVARQLSNPESDICHFRTTNAAEHYLRLDDERFVRKMAKIIRRTIKVIREVIESGEANDTESHRDRLRAAVKARRAKKGDERLWISSTEAAGRACKVAYH